MKNQNLPNQCTGNSRHTNRDARSPQLSAAEGIVQFAHFDFCGRKKRALWQGLDPSHSSVVDRKKQR
jgi:hypothetical protein